MTILFEWNTTASATRYTVPLPILHNNRQRKRSAKTTAHRIQKSRRIESMVEQCRIQPGCLDVSLVRTSSLCKQRSLKTIQDFCLEHKVLRNYDIINSRRIPERSVLVATEILGADRCLSGDQLEQKSRYHLLMSVQMTAQWLFDDTLDDNTGVSADFAAEVVDFYLAVLESDAELSDMLASLQTASLKHGISEYFVEALYLLAQWQRHLALAVNISLAPGSLYSVLNREFLVNSIQNHDAFDSWDQFAQYRSANSGLSLEILCGVYWYCHLWNIDPEVMEQQSEKYLSLIYRYSLLGGVSNDLFGYDKDVAEAVATSVEVVRRRLSPPTGDNDSTTAQAFLQVIDFHNRRLEELTARLCRCENPAELVVLFAAMTTTWSIRFLHHQFKAIYPPVTLRKVLAWSTSQPANRYYPVLRNTVKCRTDHNPVAGSELE